MFYFDSPVIKSIIRGMIRNGMNNYEILGALCGTVDINYDRIEKMRKYEEKKDIAAALSDSPKEV